MGVEVFLGPEMGVEVFFGARDGSGGFFLGPEMGVEVFFGPEMGVEGGWEATRESTRQDVECRNQKHHP